MPSKSKPSSTPLRRIAVFVDEPEPGWFAWSLIEAGEDLANWSQIDSAEDWLRSYQLAMAAGLLALQAMVGDLDRGPREEPPTKARKPAGTISSASFGFGFGARLP